MNVINLIKNCQNILIVGHVRPDGDCFGSGLSLLHVCEKLEKTAFFVCDSELSKAYSFMHGYENVNKFESLNFDLVIAVDCGDSSRMGKYKEYLKKAKSSINIDHHITNDGYAKFNIVQPHGSSTCQMIFEILENNFEIDPIIANLLFVGLSTDTGHFVHNTTTKEVFLIAAKLVECGAKPFEVCEKLYKSRTLNKTKLIERAIHSMRFFYDNTICVITITAKDLLEFDCKLSDTEGLIDYATSIGTVKVAACIAEERERSYKVGLRSKGTNVSKVAAHFGGGGHERAAGCMLNGFCEDVIDKLVRVISNEIEGENERNN